MHVTTYYSISRRYIKKHIKPLTHSARDKGHHMVNLPSQLNPSTRSYPAGQEQRNPPSVLVQLWLQLPLFAAHSSMSGRTGGEEGWSGREGGEGEIERGGDKYVAWAARCEVKEVRMYPVAEPEGVPKVPRVSYRCVYTTVTGWLMVLTFTKHPPIDHNCNLCIANSSYQQLSTINNKTNNSPAMI